MENQIIKKKICLLGLYSVGKTSMVRQFVFNKFEDKYLSTIGVHISKKKLNIDIREDIQAIEFFIWDIANIDKFDNVVNNYFRGAHGAVIVTDVTRPRTIENIKEFSDKFLEINPKAKIIFVGNKIDLVDELKFDKESYISSVCDISYNLLFTSAKTGENIEEVFIKLGEQIIEEH
jgi:small GTP-binding protein